MQDSSETARYTRWQIATIGQVVNRLKKRIEEYKADPKPGHVAKTLQAQEQKFQYINELIAEYEKDGKRGLLYRIAASFISEFAHQSEKHIVELDIRDGKNPSAQAYWDAQESEALHDAAQPGTLHSAVSLRRLIRRTLDNKGADASYSPAYMALGEIIYVTAQVFKEEYPKYDAVNPPVASVYNDFLGLIGFAGELDRIVPAHHALFAKR